MNTGVGGGSVGDDGPERLITALVTDLSPVAPLPSPFARALRFAALLPLAAAGLVVLSRFSLSDNPAAVQPYLVGAAAAALLTSAAAAWAAFATSLPDRSARWALLPLPALGLWLALTGAGCVVAGDSAWGAARPRDGLRCLAFIVVAAVPLAAVMGLMLRRAPMLRPRLATLLGGLAAASGAAGLLVVVHPHGSAVLDVVAHAAAVAAVTAAAGAMGGRFELRPS